MNVPRKTSNRPWNFACANVVNDPMILPLQNTTFYSTLLQSSFYFILFFIFILQLAFCTGDLTKQTFFFHSSLYSSSFLFLFHLRPFNVLQCGISRSKVYFILIFCLVFFFYQPRNVFHPKDLAARNFPSLFSFFLSFV